MSLLIRRMMMQQKEEAKLFDIETARKETESWRNIKYTVSDGAVHITSGSYSWSVINVYLDNCVSGKKYKISFKCKTERTDIPQCQLNVDGVNTQFYPNNNQYAHEFTCGEEIPILRLLWSASVAATEPITYYDFLLEEI